MFYLIGVIVWGVVWGFATRTVIYNKGYDDNWFWWGFFFGFVALIVACAKPENKSPKLLAYSGTEATMFYCPKCHDVFGVENGGKPKCQVCGSNMIQTTFTRSKWRALSYEERQNMRSELLHGDHFAAKKEDTHSVDMASASSSADQIKKYAYRL